MSFFMDGGPNEDIQRDRRLTCLQRLLDSLQHRGPLRRVLIVPPDFTRRHSEAGEITCDLFQCLARESEIDILPATGTHDAMTPAEIAAMFPGIPGDRFFAHDSLGDLNDCGEIPADVVNRFSKGRLKRATRVQIDSRVFDGYDAIISIGQLVPHEVSGIANHCKNILIGLGGDSLIGLTHYLGAVYGMERIMGRAQNPVRDVLNYAAEKFLTGLPITYVLTVRAHNKNGQLVTRGMFAGVDVECFQRGAELCRSVNIVHLDRLAKKIVVQLPANEYKSTWLANKAIYRTRMAIARGGEVVVLAPGVAKFGERPDIDALIRKFGYCGTTAIMQAVDENGDLASNLAAAAHLIHGSTDGRFSVTYCPGKLSRRDIEAVGYQYADLESPSAHYNCSKLQDGWNEVAGEEIYYISNPGLGLWSATALD